jgi:hypothetical protein
MKDFHDEPAFIPTHQYAAGASVAVGEIGMVDSFKIIVAALSGIERLILNLTVLPPVWNPIVEKDSEPTTNIGNTSK